MARGKHAVAAATRRYEASIDHIDRLTTELVEAKTRARRFEADARRLPVVERELRRQKGFAERGSSHTLEAERAKWQTERDGWEDRIIDIGLLIHDRLGDTPLFKSAGGDRVEWMRLFGSSGMAALMFGGEGATRTQMRNVMMSGSRQAKLSKALDAIDRNDWKTVEGLFGERTGWAS